MNWNGLFETGLSTANTLIADKQSSKGAAPLATGNSVPNAGTNDDLASWLNRGVAVYRAVTGSPKLNTVPPPDVPTARSQVAGSSSVNWKLWAVVGAALVAVFFIFRK